MLHPFLRHYGLSIAHFSHNLWSDYRDSELFGCIISLRTGEALVISHDLQGGTTTSINVYASDNLARMILEDGPQLEKLVKNLELPVVAHPFTGVYAGVRKPAAAKKRTEKDNGADQMTKADLYKPSFHLIAGSYCDY